MRLTAELNRLSFDDAVKVREIFSELTGRKVDDTFILIPPFYTAYGLDIRVGHKVFINQCCTLYDMGGVDIADHVMIGPNARLSGSSCGGKMRVERAIYALSALLRTSVISSKSPGFSIAGLRPRPVPLGRPNIAMRKFASRISEFFTSRESKESSTTVAPEPDSRGPNVNIIATNHPLEPSQRRAYIEGKPIVIEKNVWIATGATILGGVVVGENAVVAAGAVVTKDVPPNSMVAGVPAKVIRSLEENPGAPIVRPSSSSGHDDGPS